jgi:S-DNA-T family DNA segregation ATPase FtsK/SpoIIIE
MVALRSNDSNYWNIAGAIAASTTLWLIPIFAKFDLRYLLATNALALGAGIYGCSESVRLLKQNKRSGLQEIITNEVLQEWVDLEADRRKTILRERYGLIEVAQQVEQLVGEAEEEWQPVNPFQGMTSQAAQLMTALDEFQVNATHTGQIEGASIIRHKLKPGKGVSTKKIKALADDLKVALSLPTTPLITEQAGYVAVDIPCSERKVLYFKDYIQPEQRPNDSPVMLALGVNLLGELVEGNISDPTYCHGLGAGKTGSGKTELIIATTKSLTNRYSPELVKYVIHTMKAQDFREPFFQGNPWMWRATSRHALTALELVKDLVIEMRGRNEYLAENSSKNIDEHNRKYPDAPMAHILFHFDELGGTMLALKQLDRDSADEKDAKGKSLKTAYYAEMNDGLKALAKEARAAGIHLFCWDQKPSEKTIDTDVRSELGLRTCLMVADAEASKMVLGVPDADQLLGKGDMLVRIDGKLERLQGLLVTPDLLEGDAGWQTDKAKPTEPKQSESDSPDDVYEQLYELWQADPAADLAPLFQKLTGRKLQPEKELALRAYLNRMAGERGE